MDRRMGATVNDAKLYNSVSQQSHTPFGTPLGCIAAGGCDEYCLCLTVELTLLRTTLFSFECFLRSQLNPPSSQPFNGGRPAPKASATWSSFQPGPYLPWSTLSRILARRIRNAAFLPLLAKRFKFSRSFRVSSTMYFFMMASLPKLGVRFPSYRQVNRLPIN